jgi:hypothetical protein
MVKIFQPVHVSKCEMVVGANEEDAGKNLAKKMAEARLL